MEYGGDEPLSGYEVEFSPGIEKPRALVRPVLFETKVALPQPRLFALFALGDEGWLKTLRIEDYTPRRPLSEALQQSLFPYHARPGREIAGPRISEVPLLYVFLRIHPCFRGLLGRYI